MNAPSHTRRSKRLKKWGIIALFVGVCFLILYALFRPKEAPPNYLTADVAVGDVVRTVMASGIIKPITSVNVGSQVSGEITELHVSVGDTVKAGDLIAQIDQIEQQNNLKNAEAVLSQAQAGLSSAYASLGSRQGDVNNAAATIALRESELAKAEADHQRLASLLTIDAISRQEYENSIANLQIAKANLAAANTAYNTAQNSVAQSVADIQSQEATIVRATGDVSTAQKNLGHTTITAPIFGTIVNVATEKGATVNANQSTPTIVTLADLSRVRINAEISEADVVHIKAGMPAKFNIIGNPEQKFDAVLSGIEPGPITSDGEAVYYLGYLDVDNSDGKFRIGMTAQVDIITNEAKDVLTIPSSALENQNGKDVVKVIGSDGIAISQEVSVGLNNRVVAEIKSGLNAGDTVVISDTPSDGKNRRKPW